MKYIKALSVCVSRCPESSRLRGTSEDIPGVCLETDTIEEMRDAIEEVVPYLIEKNLEIDESDLAHLHLLVVRQDVSWDDAFQRTSPGRPKLIIEHQPQVPVL